MVMKWIAVLLVSCMFVLTVQPVMSNVYAMTKHHTCCDHSCCKDKQAPGRCMPESCNACATCASCLGFFNDRQGFKFNTADVAKVFASTDTEKLVSNYLANCFHPPKMV